MLYLIQALMKLQVWINMLSAQLNKLLLILHNYFSEYFHTAFTAELFRIKWHLLLLVLV